MHALLLQAAQNDLFSLILSLLVIAIPFYYITRMSAAARNRQQRPPRAPDADPDADLRLLQDEDEQLEEYRARKLQERSLQEEETRAAYEQAYEPQHRERDARREHEGDRSTRRERLRRSLSRPHPYADAETERKTPVQLLREALQRTRGEAAAEEAETRAGETRAAKRGRTAAAYETSAREAGSKRERDRDRDRHRSTYTSKISPDLEHKRLAPAASEAEHGGSSAESADPYARRRVSGLARIRRLPQLQQAVLWSEILGSPKGLPEDDRDRGR